jgi:hypothetical protein
LADALVPNTSLQLLHLDANDTRDKGVPLQNVTVLLQLQNSFDDSTLDGV